MLKNDLIDLFIEEIKAKISAIDLRIAREIGAHADAEIEALKLRNAIEHSAPLAHQKRMEAISLRESYLRAPD